MKPELVAPGESPESTNVSATNHATPYYYGGVYMAAESYDPLGVLFSSTGFVAAEGTSFSTPITAGAAALVLQAHPSVTGAARLGLVRSALVNNAAQTVTEDDGGNPVDEFEIGAGLLDVGAAVTSSVSVSPSTLSFGVLANSVPPAQQLTFTNSGASAVTLAISVTPNTTLDLAGTLTLTPSTTSLPLAAGRRSKVTITPGGTVPSPGFYSGVISVTGTGVALTVPYVYILGDGIPAYLFADTGGFDGTVGQDIPAVFGELHSERRGLLDHGAYYAQKTQLDTKGNRILWGWIPETRPEAEFSAAGWAGCMALPRVLSLDSDGRLEMQVAAAAQSLRAKSFPLPRHNASVSETNHTLEEIQIENLAGEIAWKTKSMNSEFTLLDRSGPWWSAKMAARGDSAVTLTVNGTSFELPLRLASEVEFHLFLDASVAELICNRQHALTTRIYRKPDGPLHARISENELFAPTLLEVQQLRPISPDRLTA